MRNNITVQSRGGCPIKEIDKSAHNPNVLTLPDQKPHEQDTRGSKVYAVTSVRQGTSIVEEKDQTEVGSDGTSVDAKLGKSETILEHEDTYSPAEVNSTDRTGDVGKKSYIGRSCNDQAVSDTKSHARDETDEIDESAKKSSEVSQKTTEENAYIHTLGPIYSQKVQLAISVYYAGVHPETPACDRSRSVDTCKRTNIRFSGVGVSVGIIHLSDREHIVQSSGPDGLIRNSTDLALDRDHATESSLVPLITTTYTSCPREETTTRNLNEHCPAETDDVHSIGSSTTFQKKNLDTVESARGKIGCAHGVPILTSIITKGTFSVHNKDTQEDKESIPDVTDIAKGRSVSPIGTTLITQPNKQNTEVSVKNGPINVIDVVDHSANYGAFPCDVYGTAGCSASIRTDKGTLSDESFSEEHKVTSLAPENDTHEVTSTKIRAEKCTITGVLGFDATEKATVENKKHSEENQKNVRNPPRPATARIRKIDACNTRIFGQKRL